MKRPSRLLPDGAGTAGPARAARTMSLGSERNHASAGCRWVKAGHKLARHEVLLSAWSFIPSVSPSPAHLGRAGWWLAGVSTAGMLSSSLQGPIHGVPPQTPPGPENRKLRGSGYPMAILLPGLIPPIAEAQA